MQAFHLTAYATSWQDSDEPVAFQRRLIDELEGACRSGLNVPGQTFFSNVVCDWLDQRGILYHCEVIWLAKNWTQRPRGNTEFYGHGYLHTILFIYEPEIAFELRLHWPMRVLNGNWREELVNFVLE
ncbi:MAG: hypothetical protein EOP83_29545 [Verrucomicrobiaceae bacterium]|nr:MAG: hypothetical protein EOP83_29545 [Verrucomicrobiaceae bacterium]